MMRRQGETLTFENALTRMQTLCARSEQSSGEIMQRLYKLGASAEMSRRVVEALIDERYVDDGRFAREFVRDKVVFNRWGRIKIRLALKQKRVADELISQALADIDESEYRRALEEVVVSKARTMTETETFESRSKIARHAMSRGFEPALVVEVVKRRPWVEAD